MIDPRMLAQLGRNGDTMIAHISPHEALALRMMGGAGTINPMTGLPEFWDDGGNDPGGVGGDTGSTGYGGDGGAAPAGGEVSDDYSDVSVSFEGIDQPGVTVGPVDQTGFYSGIMDDYLTIGTLKNVPGAFLEQYGPVIGGLAAGPLGYGAVSAMQGKGKQAGVGIGSTIGGMIAGPIGMGLGALAGYGLGGLMEGGLTAPDRSPGDDEGNPASGGTDYSSMAQNMVAGPTGVSTAQTVAQPESFDREAFGKFGQGMIQSQSRNDRQSAKAGSANRGMGQDSGQLAGQLAVQQQRAQKQMAQWQQMMSDPNMGYQDLAQSLMNILA